MYIIQDGQLYTSNNGWDKKENPLIPLVEFLEDVLQLRKRVNKDVADLMLKNGMKEIENELNRLPTHMKTLGQKDLTMFKSMYDIE